MGKTNYDSGWMITGLIRCNLDPNLSAGSWSLSHNGQLKSLNKHPPPPPPPWRCEIALNQSWFSQIDGLAERGAARRTEERTAERGAQLRTHLDSQRCDQKWAGDRSFHLLHTHTHTHTRTHTHTHTHTPLQHLPRRLWWREGVCDGVLASPRGASGRVGARQATDVRLRGASQLNCATRESLPSEEVVVVVVVVGSDTMSQNKCVRNLEAWCALGAATVRASWGRWTRARQLAGWVRQQDMSIVQVVFTWIGTQIQNIWKHRDKGGFNTFASYSLFPFFINVTNFFVLTAASPTGGSDGANGDTGSQWMLS